MDQKFDILRRLKEANGDLSTLTEEERMLLIHMLDKWCAEVEIPSSVYGEG